jgi:hypothetical protein
MFEIGICSGGGEYALDDLRSNDLAGSAPGGEAVEDHERVLDCHGLLEVLGPEAQLLAGRF